MPLLVDMCKYTPRMGEEIGPMINSLDQREGWLYSLTLYDGVGRLVPWLYPLLRGKDDDTKTNAFSQSLR